MSIILVSTSYSFTTLIFFSCILIFPRLMVYLLGRIATSQTHSLETACVRLQPSLAAACLHYSRWLRAVARHLAPIGTARRGAQALLISSLLAPNLQRIRGRLGPQPRGARGQEAIVYNRPLLAPLDSRRGVEFSS